MYLGIGVQGLADVFMMLDMEYGDDASRKLNIHIFETMYYAAVTESCTIARELGKTYPSFPGSPMSRGILQVPLALSLEYPSNPWLY